MPKIMRPGGLNLVDDVLRIIDMAAVAQKRPRLETDAPAPAETRVPGEGAAEENAVPEADGGGAPGAEDEGLDAGVKEQIIQSAMGEAGRILEDAVKDAEKARAERLAGVRQEAEEIRLQAAEEGRHEGRQAVLDGVKQAADELEGAVARFEGGRAGFEAEYEAQLQWLAMEIASKVLAKKMNGNDTELAEMVQKAVQGVKNETWIRIEVSQEMTGLIDRLTALYDGQANVEVGAIPAEAGTVHIETPAGVVDASLRTQLANLRDYFTQNAQKTGQSS